MYRGLTEITCENIKQGHTLIRSLANTSFLLLLHFKNDLCCLSMIMSAKGWVLSDILCLEPSASNIQKFIQRERLETRVVLAQWKKKFHCNRKRRLLKSKIVSRVAN